MSSHRDEMMVVTCLKCRAWYNMDYEYHLDDEHFSPRTGELCVADDTDWDIRVVPYREDWRIAH